MSVSKLDEVYAKIRTLHAQVAQSQHNACDKAVADVHRHVCDALELEFPEAFTPMPVLSKETLDEARRHGEKFTGYSFAESRALGCTIVALVDDYERRHGLGVEPEQTPGPGFSLIECDACERYYVRSNAQGRKTGVVHVVRMNGRSRILWSFRDRSAS